MRQILNIFSGYYNTWKLHVLKQDIFSSSRDKTNVKFTFIDLEAPENYNYKGVSFNLNNSFEMQSRNFLNKHKRQWRVIYYKIRNIVVPIDLQLKLFDTLVSPILLYASEVTGFEK